MGVVMAQGTWSNTWMFRNLLARGSGQNISPPKERKQTDCKITFSPIEPAHWSNLSLGPTRELSSSLLLLTCAQLTPFHLHTSPNTMMPHCSTPGRHLVLVRICRSMSSLPRALSRSRACVWSAPSPDIFSSCFLTDRTSSSQDI